MDIVAHIKFLRLNWAGHVEHLDAKKVQKGYLRGILVDRKEKANQNYVE